MRKVFVLKREEIEETRENLISRSLPTVCVTECYSCEQIKDDAIYGHVERMRVKINAYEFS